MAEKEFDAMLPEKTPKAGPSQKAVHLMVNEGDFDALKVFSLGLQKSGRTDGSVSDLVAILIANALPAVREAASGGKCAKVEFSADNYPLPDGKRKRAPRMKGKAPENPPPVEPAALNEIALAGMKIVADPSMPPWAVAIHGTHDSALLDTRSGEIVTASNADLVTTLPDNVDDPWS